MKSVTLFCFLRFIVFVLGSGSGNLTNEENKLLQSICGKQKLPKGSLHRKSFGGKEIQIGDASWSAFIWNGYGACSGTLISPRHVLTAAHCVVHNKKNASERIVLQKKIKLGSDCVNWTYCDKTSSQPYALKSVTFPKLFLSTGMEFDLAILELNSSVPEKDATPICIAKKDTKLHKYIFGVGYGRDVAKKSSGVLQSYNLTFEREAACINYKSINYEQYTDQGDSGSGGLQVRKDDVYEVVGIEVGTAHNAKDVLERQTVGRAIFSDVRKLSDWICIYSGVCPDKSKEELSAFVLFNPEASVNYLGSEPTLNISSQA